MGDLLCRDLKRVFCLRNSIVIMLVLHIVLMRFFSDGGTVFEIVVLLAGLLVNTMVSYDQQENGMSALIDPGTDLRAYVREKFILLACMEVIGVIVGSVLWRISGIISSRVDGTDTVIVTALFCVPICISFTSVFMPIDLKYGPKKTRVFKIIGIGILISFFAGAFTNFWYWIDPYLGSRMTYYWNAIIPSWMEMLGFIVSAAAIVAVSYHISIRTVTEKGYCLDDKIKAGNVSKNIKLFRISEDMTQDQLAERMNVTRQAVNNWETEKTQPDIETIDRLAGIFKTDIYEFIYGEPNIGYRTYQRKYFVVAAICAAAILLVLSVGKFLSDYYWGQEFSEGLPLFELFNYMIPCVSETIILFLSGTMTVSVLSIWFDISAQKRKELLIIGGIIFALLSLYYCVWGRGIASNSDESYRFVLVYLQWWKRIAFLWFPPFCLGVIAFVCTNSTFCSDNS